VALAQREEIVSGAKHVLVTGAVDHTLQVIAKRIVDVVLASILLVLLTPMLLIVAALIRLDSKGPVIFVQRRVGLLGREFRMLKFRSMCADAEDRLAGLAHLNVGGEHLIRIKKDPRITRFGSVLRRMSLDELPQLVNVVKGDMSLVGPRPQSPNEVALYTARERERLSVRPGMTGLWQVTARDNPSFDEWIRLDLEYMHRWNLLLDMKILLQTPAVVLRTTNRSTGDMG
jgi:lipopolysaccharide/colanic/teichoic acid biosynthesis glycosyltransferase